ncbi:MULTISPECIES: hypothetical protein [unclassified Salinibacterium]|nr:MULTISPECIES: hypothetical protein [unclassified Salinibacterium]
MTDSARYTPEDASLPITQPLDVDALIRALNDADEHGGTAWGSSSNV